MALYKNKASQKLAVYAHDTGTDAPKTGDGANITAQISLDGGSTAATNDANPTELDATDAPGVYLFDLTQAESNADLVIVAAVSATSGVQIEPVIVYTEPEVRTANPDSTGLTAIENEVLDAPVAGHGTAGSVGARIVAGAIPGDAMTLVADQAVNVTKWGGTAIAAAYVQANVERWNGNDVANLPANFTDLAIQAATGRVQIQKGSGDGQLDASNGQVDLKPNQMQVVMLGGLDTSGASLAASGDWATAQGVWEYAERTLTSAGAGGATAQEVWEYAERTLSAGVELTAGERTALAQTMQAWGAWGDPAVLAAIASCATRRVDFLGVGDSNELLGGYGFNDGWQYALAQFFPMYATGMLAYNENSQNGSATGYGYGVGSYFGYATGAPAELEQYLDGHLFPANCYAYLTEGLANWGGALTLNPDCVLDCSANLRFEFWYGTFPDGTGSFKPVIRTGVSGGSALVARYPTLIQTNTGQYGIELGQMDLAAGTRTTGLEFAICSMPGQTPAATGLFFATYVRAINRDRPAGFSYTTLRGAGGESLRDLANSIMGSGEAALLHLFGSLRRAQTEAGGEPAFVFIINSGLNDRGEVQASVGPLQITDADSPEAYIDNLRGLIGFIEDFWQSQGWSASELHWVVMPSHVTAEPEDAELSAYRRAAALFAASRQRVLAVDFTRFYSYAEMAANGWYNNGGADVSHLTQAGYQAVALEILSELLRQAKLFGRNIVTDLPAMPAGWISAEGIAAGALAGKGDWASGGNLADAQAAIIAALPAAPDNATISSIKSDTGGLVTSLEALRAAYTDARGAKLDNLDAAISSVSGGGGNVTIDIEETSVE